MKRLWKTALAIAAAGGCVASAPALAGPSKLSVTDAELVAARSELAAVAPSAPLYSNLVTDAGGFLLNGGVSTSGTTRYTAMACNKLTLGRPGPQLITAYSVVLHNENAAAFTPSTTSVLFYDTSGTGGAPGVRLTNKADTYYGGGSFSGVAIPATGKYQLNAAPTGYTATYVPAATSSEIPKIWACAQFGAASGSATQLANLGVQKYTNSPTVGSTEDLAFVSTLGEQNPPDNPVGTMAAGTGSANVFGWELTTLGTNPLLDSYQVVNASGTVGTAGFALNPSTGVEKNFSGYAATIAAPPAGTRWSVTGMVLYPSCAIGNYTSLQATVQLWNTFNGSTAADVFANSAPLASTTVDLGAFNCASATSVYQFPVLFPTPIVVGTTDKLGITVKYDADAGSGIVPGSFLSVIQNAPTASPLIAVGTNASTGATGWYKSASNRADLNFTGSSDYVTGTRQHITLRVYGDAVPLPPTTYTVTPSVGTGSGTISPNTPQTVNSGATTTFTLAAASGFHVDNVTGTCSGTLTGNSFTTAAVTQDCTVVANFAADTGGSEIVCSAPLNHTTLANGNGSYYNWITGVIVDDSASGPPGFHFNPYGASKLSFFWGSNTKNAGVADTTSGTTWKVLQAGAQIGPSSTFSRGTGNATNWVLGTTDGYLGFSFDCSTLTPAPASGTCYGYAHMTATGTTGIPSQVIDYCYNKAGNAITILGGGGPIAPTVAKAFSPVSAQVNANSTLTITLANANASAATLSAALVDTFPAGLVTAATPNASTTCTGGAGVTTTSGSVTLASGAAIPASGSCTVKVDVTSATAGSYANTIAAGALQTDKGNNAAAASATLTVTPVGGDPDLVCAAPNHALVDTFDGSSINWITGVIDDVGNQIHWNPYNAASSGTAMLAFYWPTAGGGGGVATGGVYSVLQPGSTIGSSSTFIADTGANTTAVSSWRAGANGYLGFKLTCSAGTCYGYAHLTTTATGGFPATLVDYCYNKAGNPITIVGGGSVAPTVAKAFSPASVQTGASSTLTITLNNTNAAAATLSADLTDTFPTGLVTAATPNASTTCTGGAGVTTTGGSVTLASGAAIPANGSCTVKVDVTSATAGSYANTIAAGALQTDKGNNVGAASATLTVTSAGTNPTISVTPASVTGSATAGASTTVALTIKNNGSGSLNWSIDESPASPSFPMSSGEKVNDAPAASSSLKQAPIRAGWSEQGKFATIPTAAGTAKAVINTQAKYVSFDPAAPGGMTSVTIASGSVANMWGGGFLNGDGAVHYLLGDAGLKKYTVATNAVTTINASTGGGDVWAATIDPTSGVMYFVGPSSAQKLYSVDVSTGTSTLVGTISGPAAGHIINSLTADAGGQLWAVDKTSDTLVKLSKATAASTSVGALGIDSENVASLAFGNDGVLYFATPLASSAVNLYSVNTTSGATTLLGPLSNQIQAMAFAGGGTPPASCQNISDVPWLSSNPTSGTTAAGASSPVTVSLNAASLPAGTYSANLCVNSNDAANPKVVVPVSFTVTPPSGGSNGIITSGPLSHSIMNSTLGTSLNMATSAFDDGGSTAAPWDFNFWGSSGVLTLWKTGNTGAGHYAVDASGKAKVFQVGEVIGPSTTFTTGAASGSVAVAAAWLAGTDGYLGVKFNCNGRLTFPVASGVCYGYIHMQTTAANGFPATILDTAFDGDGNPITIDGGTPLNPPVASVSPILLNMTSRADQTATSTLNIANAAGSSALTWSISARPPSRALNPVVEALSSKAGKIDASFQDKLLAYRSASKRGPRSNDTYSPIGDRSSKPWAPSGTVQFVLDDGNYEGAIGWTDGGDPATETAAVWLNRFHVDGATTIDSVSITWPQNNTGSVVGKQANIVVYYDSASTGSPAGAVRLGTDKLVTIASLDTFENYVTSFNVPGAGDVYIGFVDHWAMGDFSPALYPAALDSSSATHNASFISANDVGAPDLATLANNDYNATIEALSSNTYKGNWLIRATGTGGGTGGFCTGPVIPWLTATPSSGSVNGGANVDVAIKANPAAGGLSAGSYTGELCITTNDPARPLLSIPVNLTVTAAPVAACSAADTIFCNGFESAAPVDPNIVSSGPIDVTIPETIDGIYINYLTGATSTAEPPVYHFDPYSGGDQLLFYWGGSTAFPDNAGVAQGANGPYLVLHSGDVVGPSSTFIRTANGSLGETANFLVGVDGYLGVKFKNSDTGQVNYGYVRLKTTAGSGFPAKILEYAYNKAGQPITIP